MFQGLAIAKLERLGDRQEQGFDSLERLLDENAVRLEDVLSVTEEARDEAHGARVAAEELLAQFRQLEEEIAALRKEKNLPHAVRPGDNLSIRNDRERQRVKDFLRRLHDLPTDVQNSDPAVLNDLGVLEHAIGEHEAALQCFAQTAAVSTDVRVEAEARNNAYRTFLEQGDAGDALVEMLGAAALDLERFAPFPTDKYEPQRTLGWGGFGVAVRLLDDWVRFWWKGKLLPITTEWKAEVVRVEKEHADKAKILDEQARTITDRDGLIAEMQAELERLRKSAG